ncbi:B12-binding domain-containing radical SAM protein [Albimonas sp. CAU 1670]|uniref:B12-binding domain-containing radical SAM protein n=1 Tax=Albimonas sp. CAU 1670 TaxID=3032599 RepID=UPI0023D9AA09|nr:B12-binding domain-containing radical SAM protein [Albimonas sp. CAU 1670]MDF2235860.1 B12-binding domain-containing radical SAM protein [Albimonas sp. CAU 1670]
MPYDEPNVLLVHPRFAETSFWNYTSACELVGARYPAPPLGLITVAAMLPERWDVRLVDCNVRTLDPADLEWADLVFVGGMISQMQGILEMLETVRAAGKVSVLGGPEVSSRPELYPTADFRIVGEAEGAMAEFIAAWERGERQGLIRAPLHTVDVETSPLPRYDLLDLTAYTHLGVQFSRGCPFLCEFCDIIELFGRKPRTKTPAQVLAELDMLHALGWRGHVDFVDDNLIGNKKAVMAFLPHLIDWQRRHGHPFYFSTEGSLNLADDPKFLALLRDAGFFAVFVGIESPDPDVLIAMQKKQNTRRDIAESVRKINAAGVMVIAGFIIGFDDEGPDVARAQIELIEECSIAVAMVGLLYALPNTQLSRRLVAEKRLADAVDTVEPDSVGIDQCTAGLNFLTKRPRVEIIRDFIEVVEHLYAPDRYFERVRRAIAQIDASGPCGDFGRATIAHELRRTRRLMWSITRRRPEMRGAVWRLFLHTALTNPRALRHAMNMAAIYAHLGPFSGYVADRLREKIRVIEADPTYEDRWLAPRPAPAAAPAERLGTALG